MKKIEKIEYVGNLFLDDLPFDPFKLDFEDEITIDTAHSEISKRLQDKKKLSKEEADEQAGRILSAAKKQQTSKKTQGSEKQLEERKTKSFDLSKEIDQIDKKYEYSFGQGLENKSLMTLRKEIGREWDQVGKQLSRLLYFPGGVEKDRKRKELQQQQEDLEKILKELRKRT